MAGVAVLGVTAVAGVAVLGVTAVAGVAMFGVTAVAGVAIFNGWRGYTWCDGHGCVLGVKPYIWRGEALLGVKAGGPCGTGNL